MTAAPVPAGTTPSSAAPSGPAPSGPASGGELLAELARAVAGPLICAVVLLGLLFSWVATGGAGTLARTRLQITLAAVPVRGFTAHTAVGRATTFMTIRNLTGTPDELLSVTSPVASRIVLTERTRPGAPQTVVGGLAVPARSGLILSPVGDDIVLQDPVSYEYRTTVPLTLTFRHAGAVTINAVVTLPGTP